MIAAKTIPPLLIALILGTIAALSAWTQEPWLAPSLGSALFTQLLSPAEEAAKPYSIFVGQVLGGIAGFAAVFIASATTVPPFFGAHPLVFTRVLAVVIAVLLAASFQLACKAKAPAGGTTSLIVAIGAEMATWKGALDLLVGIVLITILGEAARRFVLRLQSRSTSLLG